MQVDFFVLQASPKPLDENVVGRTSFTIHDERHVRMLL
jgi:hypothetical protein